ncbi:S-layer homology domain-containing protein [Paenibacillus sp. YYML68]|uniref:S-layer homology domain-containing protein n=1 Tax=Paenibacillus sp. YYML68 TaxID=2909250 RepID=UPI002490F0A2|nr:S-layer homology domain-containing protein [Paenibacillus sp. YYML68]
MGDSSSYMNTSKSNKETTKNPKDIRGGEKKVMKKSLSAILSLAMAFSMFSSVAFGAEEAKKTSADFDDLKDLSAEQKAIFDDMISAGVFNGVSDKTFGLKDKMNRAQFAKVAALIFDLEVDASLKTSSFADVKAEDPANGYALAYIEAVKKAGITDGTSATTFSPADEVTKEQLAAFLVRGLGMEDAAKASAGVTDTTVSTWAKGYVAVAVEKGLLKNGEDGKFGGTTAATRDLLVLSSAAAEKQYVPAGAVSLEKAEATGVYKVTATFNKAVEKAELTVKKGSVAVTVDKTEWSEDKKSVVLTTATKINAGEYTVSVTGLTEGAKTTATFTAEDEKVSKIDFVNANDTIAYSTNASFRVKAANQYGEATSLGTSHFTALVSGKSPTIFKKLEDGTFLITADIKNAGGTNQGSGMVPVTVYMNSTNVTVSKNFKVGTVAILSKIEAGKVSYSNNGKSLASADETVSIALNLYDQYGNEIVRKQFEGAEPEIAISNINPVITPYEKNLEVVKTGQNSTLSTADMFDDNDNARIKIKLTSKMDKSAEYTVNIYGGTSSATANFSVGASNLATKLEFDISGVTLAASDTEVKVPLNAFDANGNKLTAQEVADDASRLKFTVTNGTAEVIKTGADKGKVKLTFTATNTPNSQVFLSGQIDQSQTNTFVNVSIPVQPARIPQSISVKTTPAEKAILGASDKIEFQLKDQYGKDLKDIARTITSANGQVSEYRVKVEVTNTGSGTSATMKGVVSDGATDADVVTSTTSGTTTTYIFPFSKFDEFNKGFDLTTTASQVGKVTVKATVENKVNSGSFSEYTSPVSRSMESIKSDTKLTYSLKTVGDLFAAKDKLSVAAATYDALTAGNSLFDKKIEVVAKDSAGNTVKLPSHFIETVTASDPQVLQVATSGTDGFVIGNKAGTATVSAVVYTNKGETVNLTQQITVKADPIVVEALTAGKTSNTYSAAKTFAYEYFTDGDTKLKVVDQYGVKYENADINTASFALGLIYTVNVPGNDGNVTVNAKTGQITNVDSTVQEFVITAIAPNGKSVSVVVSR